MPTNDIPTIEEVYPNIPKSLTYCKQTCSKPVQNSAKIVQNLFKTPAKLFKTRGQLFKTFGVRLFVMRGIEKLFKTFGLIVQIVQKSASFEQCIVQNFFPNYPK